MVMGGFYSGVKNLINLASTCIYPCDVKNPLTENLVLTGSLEQTNKSYALAKISTLRLCEYIRKEDPSFRCKSIIP